MSFTILDTANTYRKMLAAGSNAERTEIFRHEIAVPFEGLVRTMGGQDTMAMLKMWGMFPEQFEGAHAAQMQDRLETLLAAKAWEQTVQALEDGMKAFEGSAVAERRVVFGLMLADLSAAPSQRGYSGFGAIPGWIMTVYGTPDAYNLHRIKACTAHELHHNIWRRIFPTNMMTWTLGEYMIMEGLAESFAQELYGEDTIGFWVTDFDMTQMPSVKQQFAEALEVTGFNVIRGYIFGDEFAGDQYGIQRMGVPTFAGYALGYHVVQAYLRRTGKRVVEATFVPAQEIIQQSAFFSN